MDGVPSSSLNGNGGVRETGLLSLLESGIATAGEAWLGGNHDWIDGKGRDWEASCVEVRKNPTPVGVSCTRGDTSTDVSQRPSKGGGDKVRVSTGCSVLEKGEKSIPTPLFVGVMDIGL